MVGNMGDADETGPLEATIKNLQLEIEQKGVESQDLQRRWIGYQTELVALQVSHTPPHLPAHMPAPTPPSPPSPSHPCHSPATQRGS